MSLAKSLSDAVIWFTAAVKTLTMAPLLAPAVFAMRESVCVTSLMAADLIDSQLQLSPLTAAAAARVLLIILQL